MVGAIRIKPILNVGLWRRFDRSIVIAGVVRAVAMVRGLFRFWLILSFAIGGQKSIKGTHLVQ